MSNELQPFIQAIEENPNDEKPRHVFADWFEERGDSRASPLRKIEGTIRNGDLSIIFNWEKEKQQALHTLKDTYTDAWAEAHSIRRQENLITEFPFKDMQSILLQEDHALDLLTLIRMQKAGSEPTVVCKKDNRFCIAEAFTQTLPERANCVYDAEAEKEVKRQGSTCNGNAVNQAAALGIALMERRIADAHIVPFPDSNQYCYDYIQATPEEREHGSAPYVGRDSGVPFVRLSSAHFRNDFQGWRGALWVHLLCTDFSHPPVCLPISSAIDCA